MSEQTQAPDTDLSPELREAIAAMTVEERLRLAADLAERELLIWKKHFHRVRAENDRLRTAGAALAATVLRVTNYPHATDRAAVDALDEWAAVVEDERAEERRD